MNWPSFILGLLSALYILIVWRSFKDGRIAFFSLVFDRANEPLRYWITLAMFAPLLLLAHFLIIGG